MENSILNFVSFLEVVDFAFFARILLAFYVIFWLFIVSWVWFDAKQRYNSIFFVIFSVISVLIFNLFGLILYLIVRPRYTKDESDSYSKEKLNLVYESQGIGYCDECGSLYYPDFVYCRNCGCELRVKCPDCGVYIEKDWKFCPFCEARMASNREVLSKDSDNQLSEKKLRSSESTNNVDAKRKYSARKSFGQVISKFKNACRSFLGKINTCYVDSVTAIKERSIRLKNNANRSDQNKAKKIKKTKKSKKKNKNKKSNKK